MSQVTGMYQIDVNELQMRVILDALDFYERVLGLGQLEEVEAGWREDADVRDPRFAETSDALLTLMRDAKRQGWKLEPNSSRSIRGPGVAPRFRIAYDMTQVLRKAVSDRRLARLKAEGKEDAARWESRSVSQHVFWATCPEVPPAVVSWKEDAEGSTTRCHVKP